jgi:hypothetical protein
MSDKILGCKPKDEESNIYITCCFQCVLDGDIDKCKKRREEKELRFVYYEEMIDDE